MLKLSQIKREKRGVEDVFVIRRIVGSVDGQFKNSKGGWNSVTFKPNQINVFKRNEMNGILNIYKEIYDYLSFRNKIVMNVDDNSIFCRRATSFDKCFKEQPLGEPNIGDIIKYACCQTDIVGIGPHDGITTHSLCGEDMTIC